MKSSSHLPWLWVDKSPLLGFSLRVKDKKGCRLGSRLGLKR